MAGQWIEKITGSFAEKKRYRQYKARIDQLPPSHHKAAAALERYFLYFGAISQGDVLVVMLEDLADLFEQGAADRTPVRAIVGDDPVEFAETFLRNYAEGQWINKERQRLVAAIDRAAGDDASPGTGAGTSTDEES